MYDLSESRRNIPVHKKNNIFDTCDVEIHYFMKSIQDLIPVAFIEVMLFSILLANYNSIIWAVGQTFLSDL